MKYTRTVPYLKLLSTAPPSKRKRLLDVFPRFAIDDITEVLYNIIRGNARIRPNERKLLFKHKSKLLKLVNAKTKAQRRHLVQKGGLIPLAPIVASVLGGIAPPLFKRFFSWLFGWGSNKKQTETAPNNK